MVIDKVVHELYVSHWTDKALIKSWNTCRYNKEIKFEEEAKKRSIITRIIASLWQSMALNPYIETQVGSESMDSKGRESWKENWKKLLASSIWLQT